MDMNEAINERMVLHITHFVIFAVYKTDLRIAQAVIRRTVLRITSAKL